MSILITGATGYIGAHITLEFLKAGYAPIALDNLSNSRPESLNRVRNLAATDCPLEVIDLRDTHALDPLFKHRQINGVIHLAGLKSVSESVHDPLSYYDNNVAGTVSLLKVMRRHHVHSVLFSSSCTVYGEPDRVPVDETAPTGNVTSPYGRTKHLIEQMLLELHRTSPEWTVTILRYFNPVGAHPSGEIGEESDRLPNHLMPWITNVAAGRLDKLTIYGKDYPTADGTAVRDYLHVMDLAEGHLAAWQKHSSQQSPAIYNLGTGKGCSVLQLVETFERTTGYKVPRRFSDRRPGDVAAVWTDPSKANRELGWRTKRDLEQMYLDSWNWQRKNPDGYKNANREQNS